MPSPANSPTSRERLSNQQRIAKAIQMRIGGATLQMIVDAGLYADKSSAHRALKNYLHKEHQRIMQDVDVLRQEEIERIDAMMRSLWPIVMDRHHDRHLYAIDRVSKLMHHRAKLLGLEMPERKEVTGADGAPLVPAGINLSELGGEELDALRQALDSAAATASS